MYTTCDGAAQPAGGGAFFGCLILPATCWSPNPHWVLVAHKGLGWVHAKRQSLPKAWACAAVEAPVVTGASVEADFSLHRGRLLWPAAGTIPVARSVICGLAWHTPVLPSLWSLHAAGNSCFVFFTTSLSAQGVRLWIATPCKLQHHSKGNLSGQWLGPLDSRGGGRLQQPCVAAKRLSFVWHGWTCKEWMLCNACACFSTASSYLAQPIGNDWTVKGSCVNFPWRVGWSQ